MQTINLQQILARLATKASPIAVELSTRAEFVKLLNTLQANGYSINNIEYIHVAPTIIRIGAEGVLNFYKIGITGSLGTRPMAKYYTQYHHYTYKPKHLVFTKAR